MTMGSDVSPLNNAIMKYFKSKETAPKLKYEKSMIAESWDENGANEIFSLIFKKSLLNNRPISQWKFWLILHKLLCNGHPNVLIHAQANISSFRLLIEMHKGEDGLYSTLGAEYGAFLVRKIEFHAENSEFDGYFSLKSIAKIKAKGGSVSYMREKVLRLFSIQKYLLELQELICSYDKNELVLHALLVAVPEVYNIFMLCMQLINEMAMAKDESGAKQLMERLAGDYPKIRTIFKFCENSSYAPLSTINTSKLPEMFSRGDTSSPSDSSKLSRGSSWTGADIENRASDRHPNPNVPANSGAALFSDSLTLRQKEVWNVQKSGGFDSGETQFSKKVPDEEQKTQSMIAAAKSPKDDRIDRSSSSWAAELELNGYETKNIAIKSIASDIVHENVPVQSDDLGLRISRMETACEKVLNDVAQILVQFDILKNEAYPSLITQLEKVHISRDSFFKSQVNSCHTQLEASMKCPNRASTADPVSTEELIGILEALKLKLRVMISFVIFNDLHSVIVIRDYSDTLIRASDRFSRYLELVGSNAISKSNIESEFKKILLETTKFFKSFLANVELSKVRDHARFYEYEGLLGNSISIVIESVKRLGLQRQV